jgi:sugar/nucleoside kinase (ribokinase family)
MASDIARLCAAAGAAVQIVGRVGEDAAGDQVLLALVDAGIGHVAVLREPGRPTPMAAPPTGGSASPDGPALGEALLDEAGLSDSDPATADDAPTDVPAGLSVDAADLELALRYVPDYRVLVIADVLDSSSLDAVVAAAGWSGAHLIAILPDGGSTSALPDTATALLRPVSDPDGTFAAMVAGYAVALDRGDEPRSAFALAQRAGGWAAVTG